MDFSGKVSCKIPTENCVSDALFSLHEILPTRYYRHGKDSDLRARVPEEEFQDSVMDQVEDPTPGQPQIEDSIDLNVEDSFATVERRYFKRLYFRGPSETEEGDNSNGTTLDQLVLVHSNKICLVSLAPNHPIITKNLTIRKLDFEGKSKFLTSKAIGKSKKQCSVVDEKTVLAWIECEPDGKR